jgi:hypothetical protein
MSVVESHTGECFEHIGAESPSFNTALNDMLFAILNTLLGKVPKSFVLRSVGSFPEGSDPDD